MPATLRVRDVFGLESATGRGPTREHTKQDSEEMKENASREGEMEAGCLRKNLSCDYLKQIRLTV